MRMAVTSVAKSALIRRPVRLDHDVVSVTRKQYNNGGCGLSAGFESGESAARLMAAAHLEKFPERQEE